VSTEETVAEAAPLMLRVDITRDELKQLKRLALELDKTVQALAGEILRERLAA
jgi:hypothetical protein